MHTISIVLYSVPEQSARRLVEETETHVLVRLLLLLFLLLLSSWGSGVTTGSGGSTTSSRGGSGTTTGANVQEEVLDILALESLWYKCQSCAVRAECPTAACEKSWSLRWPILEALQRAMLSCMRHVFRDGVPWRRE